MIDPRQFRELVIRPVLQASGLWSPAAENLLLGTALVESGLSWLKQRNDGPALGVYQMEPPTHDDLWLNLLRYKRDLRQKAVLWATSANPSPEEMIGNLNYATIIARLHYLRDPAPLPAADDVVGMARYYKRVWNTDLGKATPEQFVRNWTKHAA